MADTHATHRFVKRDPFEGLHDVAPEHAEVDAMLRGWAKWAKSGGGRGPSTAPGFALRASGAVATGSGMSDADALAVGRAVAGLAPIRGHVLRWYYLGNATPASFCRLHKLEPWWVLPRMLAYARGELLAALSIGNGGSRG